MNNTQITESYDLPTSVLNMWRSKWYNYENTQNNNLDIIYVSSLLQFWISTKESYPKKD